MTIEVLLATMFFENENDKFLDNMNIKTDIIIGNQCNINNDAILEHNGNRVKVLSRSERGVGKNRNTALLNSDADIVIFADNDIRYYDGYKEKIENFYSKNPQADIVVFNFRRKRGDQPFRDVVTKTGKAKLKDLTKIGTWAITAKRRKIIDNKITFSLQFGGGAKYSCGEDSLFLSDCYKKGLNIYLCAETLGEVIHRESTWFNGITEKYVYDKGALFKAMKPKLYLPVIIYHTLKHRERYKEFGSIRKVIKTMLKGAKEYHV